MSKCLKMLPEESDSRRKYFGIMLNKESDSSKLSHYIRFERGYINPKLNRFIRKNNDKYSYGLYDRQYLPKKNIIVGKKNLDITDEIVKLLNDKVKSLDF